MPGKAAAKTLVNALARDEPNADRRDIVLRQLRAYEPAAAWQEPVIRKWLHQPHTYTEREGIARLQRAMEEHFRKRDQTLRDTHPLGIQVHLNTGVANGVLVVNSVAQCAKLIRAIVLRELDFRLESKDIAGQNYLFLRETISNCIFRVVTGDATLANAFWSYYLDQSE
jgi:hypothetical protein